eukprot:495533-Hanusia_phi.AAC.1
MAAFEDGVIRCMDVNTGHRLQVIPYLHPQTIATDVSISADGKSFALAMEASQVWDVETAECRQALTVHECEDVSLPICLSMSCDGNKIVTGSVDGTVRVWDVKKGKCLKVFSGHNDRVNSVSMSGDGRRVASGSEDGT